MVRFIKILIETNVFISIAAVSFLWANALFLDIEISRLHFLSLQVFFSTWFVYQISRWIYFKKGEYANTEELVLLWFRKHPKFNQATIILSGVLTVVFAFFLQWDTILVLCFIGGISILYPLPVLLPLGIKTRLRDFPFIKIFLIAVVWSVTSVLLPATETALDIHERKDVLLLLITQFVFILFITLPFDINDAEVDKTINVKTIPVVTGVRASKIIGLLLGLICGLLILYVFMIENWRSIANIYLNESTIYLVWLLLFLLQGFTFYQSDKAPKWIIKLVYDGSMIVYFCILLFTVNHH